MLPNVKIIMRIESNECTYYTLSTARRNVSFDCPN